MRSDAEMYLHSVGDVGGEQVEAGRYDLAIFCSSYETRSPHVLTKYEKIDSASRIAFGYDKDLDDPRRLSNDQFFRNLNIEVELLPESDDGRVYEILNSVARPKRTSDPFRILVDYSSMSRVWYAGILSWVRYAAPSSRVFLDFLYAVGDHQEEADPVVIESISSLPGFEGEPAPLSRTIAVFGLGFDGLAALCVLDRLEPHEVYGYLAKPAAFDDYPQRARDSNAEFIQQHAAEVLELPLQSVEQTYRYLGELLRPHLASDEITMIPTGPKPHVLAAILLALRFQKIGCLHVGGQRRRREDVGTSGEIVHTRVEMRVRSDQNSATD